MTKLTVDEQLRGVRVLRDRVVDGAGEVAGVVPSDAPDGDGGAELVHLGDHGIGGKLSPIERPGEVQG